MRIKITKFNNLLSLADDLRESVLSPSDETAISDLQFEIECAISEGRDFDANALIDDLEEYLREFV